jgi:hypothetical protein
MLLAFKASFSKLLIFLVESALILPLKKIKIQKNKKNKKYLEKGNKMERKKTRD